MSDIRDIRIEDYSYELPEERIAKYPLAKRDISKLLIYKQGSISDEVFQNLSKHLDSSSTLIFNQTKVIRSRLIFKKSTGASIEIFCLEPYLPSDYEQSLSSVAQVDWICIVGNLRKWKDKSLEMPLSINGIDLIISAKKLRNNKNDIIVRFTWNDKRVTFSEILEANGHMPVPPYLKRDDEALDNIRYQTIYSKDKGSVAAPTAGLHFSDKVIEDLNAKKVNSGSITLHVGAGTFIPVKSETIGEHSMHREHFYASRECIELLKEKDIIAVGTTSVRTIESLYHLGIKLLSGYDPLEGDLSLDQWEAYDMESDKDSKLALNAILAYMNRKKIDIFQASSSIIIVPGYRFRIVKGLITNYHMPSSTLLLLVSALIGDDWRKVYKHALENDYRFLSYGDSSLLLP